jgi:hypothetical protein
VADIEEQIELDVRDTVLDCESSNETKAILRDIAVQLTVQAVAASNESIIIVANSMAEQPIPPEIADQLRSIGVEQATNGAQGVVAQLQDRDCVAEGREARRVAEDRLLP